MKSRDQILLEECYQKILLISERGYDEAWELFHLPGADVQQMVKSLFKFNYKTREEMDNDDKVDQLAERIGAIIDKMPAQKFPWNEIHKLKTLDTKWVQAYQAIQDSPNVEEECIKLMDQRDAEGEKRPGGKKTNKEIFDDVVKGLGDPAVYLKMPSAIYAVGGRTRTFVALATKTNIKAVILTPEILQRFV
jgi:hypothetical protein